MSSHHTRRRDFLAGSTAALASAGLTGLAFPHVAGAEPRRIAPEAPVRLGIIGAGGRGNELLRCAYAVKAHFTVRAIADPSEVNIGRTLEHIAKNGDDKPEVCRGEEEYRRLLAREDIDAVIIAVPPDLHARIYLDAFAAGKHMYAEKPMCVSVAEVQALVEAQARRPDVICQIGFQRRSSNFYRQAIERLHEGMCGEIFECLGAWRLSGGPLGLPDSGTQIWFGRAARSGDWMIEQACHTWDVMCWAAGDMPVAAYGRGRRGLFKHIDPDRDVTDFYLAQLEFPNGMLADFEHNWMCPQFDDDKREFTGIFERFTGPKGGIALGEWPRQARFFPRSGQDKCVDFGDLSKNTTEESVETFFRCLRSGEKPPSGVENGRLATLTGLLVRKAVYEGRRVEMKEILAG